MTPRLRTSVTKNLVRLAIAGIAAVCVPLAMTGTANAAPDGVWNKLAQCESSGNWSANTGNGFSGGLQFTPQTWRAFGGKGQAHQASRPEQVAVAERVLKGQGWGAWPACSAKLGMH
jgi:resuscitation-promoting factor RpfA